VVIFFFPLRGNLLHPVYLHPKETLMHMLMAGLLGCVLAQAPVAGIVDDSLLRPYEWVQDPNMLTAPAFAAAFEKEGFQARILKADDLTPEGFSRLRVLVIPGDHVYPERGAWGGPVLQAIADFVKRGGVYVMPLGVSHYVARDIATGARDRDHWGLDALGLAFENGNVAGGLQLTSQGKAAGIPDPSKVPASSSRLIKPGLPLAVLAWDLQYRPAVSAVAVGKGFAIHAAGNDKIEPAFAEWWMTASAKAAKAALAGALKPMSIAETLRAEGLDNVSLDDLDKRNFKPALSPTDSPATTVELTHSPGLKAEAYYTPLNLNGGWEMVGRDPGKGSEAELLADAPWQDAIPADVPCSVHTALFAAGKIPDPCVGMNADIAKEQSSREWWLRKRFSASDNLYNPRLVFDGVDYSCTVWLNGVRLGRHEGPFGGPDFEIGNLLRDRNILVVRLDPAPADWKLVFKTNVVYGWHYVTLPSLGIWQPVHIDRREPVAIEHPFVATRNTQRGEVELALTLRSETTPLKGRLEATIKPENFEGESYSFTQSIESDAPTKDVHLRFAVPNPRLWWPVDLGAPNLYALELAFVPEGEGAMTTARTTFGIRSIETAPTPEGLSPARYKWQFVINGRPVFLKGANWCTLDALLRLDRARYERFLSLARDQHVQLLRSWGGGLVETDTFYDLCDRLGILVYQEFPLTWQNFDVLSPSVVDEIAVRSVTRLRNHPSLMMWGGGNEHSGMGPVIEQIGRICYELDGTRPFHRSDPYGGSLHNYDVYWGRKPLDKNLDLHGTFIGEFGLSSPPNIESVMRYLPKDEQAAWPPPDNGSFIRHTPTFNKLHMEIMDPYASEFCDTGTMQGLITGMQLAQAEGIRHTLERARASAPDATGVCYYKLTDVYPACAWATIDFYGVPKIAYWFIKNAYAPVHACMRFESLSAPEGKDLRLPVCLLDDAAALQAPWKVVATAYNAQLQEIAHKEWSGSANPGPVVPMSRYGEGELVVPADKAASAPLLLVVEVQSEGKTLDRTFYFMNYQKQKGCLFNLPKTQLTTTPIDGGLRIANTGSVPAVAVHFECPEISDKFTAEDAYFWLNPGETRDIKTSSTVGVTVKAWNN
jgi:beta-mannosidase